MLEHLFEMSAESKWNISVIDKPTVVFKLTYAHFVRDPRDDRQLSISVLFHLTSWTSFCIDQS